MVPPPEPPANGTSSAPGVHDVCLRRKTIRSLKRGQERLDKRMAIFEGKIDTIGDNVEALVRGQESVLGGPGHVTESMAITVQTHERRLNQMDGRRSSWVTWAGGIVIMLLSVTATKTVDYIGTRPVPAIVLQASPVPSATPVVASSPSHSQVAPTGLPAIGLDGDPFPAPSAFATSSH